MRFPLGEINVTARALAVLTKSEIVWSLARHARGEWSNLFKQQRNANHRALKYGRRILSHYLTRSGQEIVIITEADRSQTNIQLAHESELAPRPTSRDAQASAVRVSSARVSPRKLPAENGWTATESEVEQLEFKLDTNEIVNNAM